MPAAVEESPVRVQIEWIDGPARGSSIDVPLGESLIGRAESCAIVVDSSAASRAHARLAVSGDRVTIEDLGSANGTTVDGQPISTPVTLHNGAEIVIGEARRFRIRLEGGTSMLATTGAAAPARAAQDMEWATRLVFSASDREAIAQATAQAMAARPTAAAPSPAEPAPKPAPAPAAAKPGPPPAAPVPPAEATIKGTLVGDVHMPTELGRPSAAASSETQYAAPSLGQAPDLGSAAANKTIVGPPGVTAPPKRFEPEATKPGEMTVLPGATVLGFREVGPPPRMVGAGGPSSSVVPGPADAAKAGQPRSEASGGPIESVTLSGEQGVFSIGRGSSTVGRAPDATVRIDSREVSRIHAVVHVSEKQVVVEDRGSVNGSSINGTAFTGNRAIEDGDRVSFADFEFRVAFKRTEGNS
jgi:pSer/pThr/pTyr-binding forkhead associated (FHA) protein